MYKCKSSLTSFFYQIKRIVFLLTSVTYTHIDTELIEANKAVYYPRIIKIKKGKQLTQRFKTTEV